MQNLHSCEKKTKSSSGFTLVELLVVCTILAIVISAIAACLAGGIRVWDSARSFHVGESDTMLAMLNWLSTARARYCLRAGQAVRCQQLKKCWN